MSKLDSTETLTGGKRPRFINADDGAVSGLECFALYCVVETVLTSFAGRGWSGTSKVAGVTLPAGTVLSGGVITGVQVTSGLVTVHS